MKRKKGLDIVRVNFKIKSTLIDRFDELGLLNKDVCEDAKEKGYTIQQSALSRYLNKTSIVVGSLTQEQILWLCCRYCIPLKIDVIKKPYNKEESEKLLTKFFG